jgi:hypothetical protein
MQIRPTVALQAILKSLTQVIVPALDPQNKMAQEQVGLVVGLLTLLEDRLPKTFAYDLDELNRWTQLATMLHPVGDGVLASAMNQGNDVLARAKATPDEVVATVGLLRAAIGKTAQRIAASCDPESRNAVQAILDVSAEQQLRERSWLLMQGWETAPDSVPAIELLIAGLGAKTVAP